MNKCQCITEKQWYGHEPDVAAFHVESGTCLEEVAACELLKHCVIVLGIVTSDVANLEENLFSDVTCKIFRWPTLGTISR
jgi:hypothetical protein